MGFDWRENQTVPGVIINPGTGPVHDATVEAAEANIKALVEDACAGRERPTIKRASGDSQGRFAFELSVGDRECEVDMPGLPLEQVRYTGPPQSIFDFPRLYVNGSSWVWPYAVSMVDDALYGERDE